MFTPTLTLPEKYPASVTVRVREDGTAEVSGPDRDSNLHVAWSIARLTVAQGTADDVDSGEGLDGTVYVTPVY